MKEKILVAAPNSFHKNYIAKEYFSLIKNLSHPDYEIFIADNSPNNENKDLYDQLGINYVWTNPKGKNSFQFIWESQNEIRNYFLDNKEFTHLCFIETDLLPPPYILEYLLAHQKSVVGLPYFIYKDNDSILMNQELDPFWTGGETRNFTLEESFMQMKGDLKMAFSIGFGCVMIERWVVATFPFRFTNDKNVQNDASGPSHADSFFYADLFMAGLEVYLDTAMPIDHYNQDWMKINIDNK